MAIAAPSAVKELSVIMFGATGMIGQGVLRECLLDPNVKRVLAIGRSPTEQKHEKLTELQHKDFTDFTPVEEQVKGYNACFYCLGATSAGKNEAEYTRITRDFPMAAAAVLSKVNPDMTFIYVSGIGADSTEKSSTMWQRIKGKAENDLQKMPFKAVYSFRPAMVRPMNGEESRTTSYRWMYKLSTPFYGMVRRFWPNSFSTTEMIGRAMLKVAREGAPVKVLESKDWNALVDPPAVAAAPDADSNKRGCSVSKA